MATSLEQRFWSKVDKSGDCWIWMGNTAGAGYGQFHVAGGRSDRVRTYAHRWAYEEANGPIPAGHELDHRCRNRRCVNPAHLEPVTRSENQARTTGIQHGPYDVGDFCRHGHPRTPENTALNANGARVCLPCRRAAVARHRAKSRSEA